MEGIAADAAQQVVERLSRSTGLINAPVMVVDDDAAVRRAAADARRDSGYQVAEASSGEGALRRLERITPSAVLVSASVLVPE